MRPVLRGYTGSMNKTGADLPSLLEALTRGATVASARLVLLSDLTRADEEAVRRAWPNIPAAMRAEILGEVSVLQDADVGLEFTRLARIGLADPEAEVRRMAIAALWDSVDRNVAADLTRLADIDPDAAVRAAAAELLGDFVSLLENDHFDPTLGEEMVQVLLRHATDDGESLDVRARALVAVSPREGAAIDAAISDAYYSEDRYLRLAAIEAMGRSAREQWLEFVDEQLLSDDPDFRYQAVVAAGEIGSEDSIDAVAALLHDEDWAVIEGAINALGEIGGEAAVEYLEEFQVLAGDELQPGLELALEMARAGGIEGWIDFDVPGDGR